MNYTEYAEIALAGEALTESQARRVLTAPDTDLLAVLDAAYRVRHRYWGKRVQIHVLTNAKSGLCPEDCHYCSQSSISDAEIERYSIMEPDRLFEEATKARAAGAFRYCMVISGRGPTDEEIDRLCEATRRIKSELPLEICCSVGLLNQGQAARFKAAGVDRINHNLNTSARHHENICTTHTYDDRLSTLRACQAEGLGLCSGAIFGQGETEEDVLSVAFAFREIGMESIPVNFLIPIEGTPFGRKETGLTPAKCLKILSLVRFLNPTREIRIAGGREVHLRSLQPLSLYPANSIFVRGYLTEPGQEAPEALRMIGDLGFEIEMAGAEAPTRSDPLPIGS